MDNRFAILEMVLNAQSRNDRYDMSEAIKDARAAAEFVAGPSVRSYAAASKEGGPAYREALAYFKGCGVQDPKLLASYDEKADCITFTREL